MQNLRLVYQLDGTPAEKHLIQLVPQDDIRKLLEDAWKEAQEVSYQRGVSNNNFYAIATLVGTLVFLFFYLLT